MGIEIEEWGERKRQKGWERFKIFLSGRKEMQFLKQHEESVFLLFGQFEKIGKSG